MASHFLRQRRNYYIKKEFQNTFILKFCILMIFACFGFGCLVYLLTQNGVTTAFVQSRLVIKSTADYLLPFLALTGLLTTVIVGLATIYTVKRLSHALAGPLYHFEKKFAQISKGDISPICIRETDQLQKTADELNEMLETVCGQLKKIHHGVDLIEHEIGVDNLELIALVRQLKSELAYFHRGEKGLL